MAISIVLADDHTVLRNGLRMLLEAEPDFHVVGEAGTVQRTFEQVRGLRPDVLVLDLHMPGGSCLDAIPRLAALSPGTSIVVVTMEDDPGLASATARAGASGFLLKDAAQHELVGAIRNAAG